MDKKNEINVMIHLPQKEADREELSARVARAHADAVLTYLKKLNCPIEQKQALPDAMIRDAKERAKD